MRLTRVYLDAPLEAGGRVTLTDSAARHLTRVLRLRPGQALTLFNGGGGEYAATIEAVHGETVAVAVGPVISDENGPKSRFTWSELMSCWTLVLPWVGSLLSSRKTSLTLRPISPPALFTSDAHSL